MSPNSCRGRRAHRGSPGAHGGCPGAPRAPLQALEGVVLLQREGARSGAPGRLGGGAPGREAQSQPPTEPNCLQPGPGGRVGRVPVVRGGRGPCLEKAPGAKPGGAPRVEDRWLRSRRQVANRSRAARRSPKVSSGPDSMLPAAGAAPGRGMGLEAAPPGSGLLCLSPRVPLSPSAQPRCPRCDPRARCR